MVTARPDLAAGATLGPDDVLVGARAVASLPVDAVADTDDLDHRLGTAPGVAGEVARGRDAVVRSPAADRGPDLVATPVRLDRDGGARERARPTSSTSPPLALVTATAVASSSVVASHVRAGTVGPAVAAGSGLLGGGASGGSSAPVLRLATTSAQAPHIAATVVSSRLSVTLHSRGRGAWHAGR